MTTNRFQPTSNGCGVARRVPRRDAGYQAPYNIAAIDFGTTNCSLAYTIAGNLPNMLQFKDSFYRVPTAVLFNKDGIVKHFGHYARRMYGSNLEDEERMEWAYFEEVKMNLQKEESVNREMTVKAQNGNEYYLVEVIAHILKHLKDELIEILKDAGYTLKATNFEWVITVPAIWRARGKQMMREAGYKAGLCSQESCTPLQQASHLPHPPEEQHPEKLSLALEPEAAAIFCQSMRKDQLAKHCKTEAPFKASCYLVIDIGGGTVDISAMHRVVENGETHIRVLHPPIGDDYGGARVNKEFQNFLEMLVRDEELKRLLSTGEESKNARNQAALNYLLNETFEAQKKLFGDQEATTQQNQLQFEFPYDFWETYGSDLEKEITTEGTRILRQKLRISYNVMAKFFEPIRDGIFKCIAMVLKDIKEEVEAFYLVGGFGGCSYLFRAIREKFGEKYKYIVPREPAYAVVRGAVLYRLHPNMVESRKVDATYGIKANISFIPHLHDPEYRWLNDDGEYQCKFIFCTIVERGDLAKSGEVFRDTYHPVRHNQTSMALEFYCSTEKNVWYVTGRREMGSHITEPAKVHKIGNIIIEMPKLSGDKKRAVDVSFDFSHTEIQVQAYDRTSQNVVRTVLDFLTC